MFRSKRLSELRRFLLSYLLLLVVPLIAIVLSYGVAQNYVRQEERNYHMMMQKQVGMALDEKLSKSNRMVLQIAADATVMAAVAEDEYHGGLSPMTGYYLLQHFTDVVLADDVEYMVYFKNSDKIFGRTSLADSDIYYLSYYEGKIPREFWEEWLSQPVRSRILSVPCKGSSTLMVQCSTSFLGRGMNECSVAVLLDGQWLHTQLNSIFPEGNGVYFLYDTYGNLLLSSVEGWKDEICPDENNVQKINGIDYRFEHYTSTNGYFEYYYALPVRQYWQKLYTMCVVLISCIVLGLAISLMLAVHLAKENYRPLKELVETVSDKTRKTYQSGSWGEYEFLGNQFEEMTRMHNLLSQRLESQESIQAKQNLKLMLLGVPDSSHTSSLELNQETLNLPNPGFCVMLFRVDSYDEAIIGGINGQPPYRTAAFLIQNVLSDLMPDGIRNYFVTIRSNMHSLVVNIPADREVKEKLLSSCREAAAFFKEHFSMVCCVSASSILTEFSSLHDGYLQAVSAQEYSYLLGTHEILDWDILSRRKNHYQSVLTAQTEQVILREIEIPEKDGREKVWSFVLASAFGESDITMEGIRRLQDEIFWVFQKILPKLMLKENDGVQAMVEQLKTANDFSDFRQQFFDLIEILNNLWSVSGREEDLCTRVNRILEQSYGDPDVNINYLGRELDLSPSYLSKIYRQKQGYSPLDYLNGIRLTKAKELLRNTNLTIEEIAEQVGFLSGNTFIRAFKRQEGITPGAYKKL